MFDNKKICQRALQRAEEIRMAKKRKRRFMMLGALMVVGMCAVALAMIVTFYPTEQQQGFFTDIGEVPVPMSEFGINIEDFMPEYGHIQIPSDTADVGFKLRNPIGSNCRFTFEIVLKGTGESMYISDMMDPSTHVDNIELTRPLADGQYAATLIIRAYELDSDSEIGVEGVEFNLIVSSQH